MIEDPDTKVWVQWVHGTSLQIHDQGHNGLRARDLYAPYMKVAQDPKWIEEMREEMWVLVDTDICDLVLAIEPENKPIGCCLVLKSQAQHKRHDYLE